MTLINIIPSFITNVKLFGAKGDGVNDDTGPIQSTITAVQNAGGGVVFLPPGTYITLASLILTGDQVTLMGAGFESIIKPASGANFDVISTPIPASSGLAGFVRNYPSVQNLKIDCSQMAGTTAGQGNAIHWYGARYGRIVNVFITGCPNWCIILDGDATPNFGFNCEVRSCIFDVCAAGVMNTGSEAHEIVQNKFKFAQIATAANQPTFDSPSTTAMHLRCKGGYEYIAGNVFGNSGTYTTEAIRVESGGPCKIIGNRFDQCHAEAIRLTSGNHIIIGNQIGNPGSTVAGKPGITLGAGNNLIVGNKFDVTNGAAAFTYCISDPSAQVNNIIADNQLVAGTTGFININSGSTGYLVKNNLGYNPQGNMTTPAFPATTVAATNTTGSDVTAYIANGTAAITVIAIAPVNGGAYITTGMQIAASGWGAIRLPAGASVKFTYASGTPTWKWFGD